MAAPTNLHRAAGFTLIEVLITVVVAAIGLLAVAGLQVMSKKFNYDSVQRTSAAIMAQSMVEKMRSNPSSLDAYLTADAASVSSDADCRSLPCTPLEIAAYDLVEWDASLQGAASKSEGTNAGGLVNPTGCVTADATVSGLYTVAVAWQGVTGMDPPDEDAPADDPQLNACGEGLGRYDDPRASGDDDRLRRVLVIQAFISDPSAP